MISRVAESCFWLQRYMERIESTARLLHVNRAFVLDAGLPPEAQWRPILVVAGEHERFPELVGIDGHRDGEAVEEYMTWDERNPVSILSSARWARENARTIREVVSLEMWQCLNEFWHWLRRGQGRRLYSEDRDAFYARVKQTSALFQGTCHNSMLHDEPFDFMRLGLLLERAGQTGRVVDVHHEMMGSGARSGSSDSVLAAAQWVAVLRSCAAIEPFSKRMPGAPGGPAVVGFLLLDDHFPRSILHCVRRAWNFLRRIRGADAGPFGARSAELLRALVEHVESLSVEAVLERGLHLELSELIESTAEVCAAVHADYFDPAPILPARAPG